MQSSLEEKAEQLVRENEELEHELHVLESDIQWLETKAISNPAECLNLQ
jgi:hypothetical protein